MRTKTIKLKQYDDGELGFDLYDLLDGTTVRPSTVKYYKIDCLEENSFSVTLYNKAKRKIKVKIKNSTEG